MSTLKQTGTVKEYVAKFRALALYSEQSVAANKTYFPQEFKQRTWVQGGSARS